MEQYEMIIDSKGSHINPADILSMMGDTYRERNRVYGNNFERVGKAMVALFPHGVVLKTEDDFKRWHLLELVIVKLSRFAVSGLTHTDSIHDSSVYGAILESLIDETTVPIQEGEKSE